MNHYILIDNIFFNDIEETMKSKSGILINNISNHQKIFTFHEYLSYIEKLKNTYTLKNMIRFLYNNLSMN